MSDHCYLERLCFAETLQPLCCWNFFVIPLGKKKQQILTCSNDACRSWILKHLELGFHPACSVPLIFFCLCVWKTIVAVAAVVGMWKTLLGIFTGRFLKQPELLAMCWSSSCAPLKGQTHFLIHPRCAWVFSSLAVIIALRCVWCSFGGFRSTLSNGETWSRLKFYNIQSFKNPPDIWSIHQLITEGILTNCRPKF